MVGPRESRLGRVRVTEEGLDQDVVRRLVPQARRVRIEVGRRAVDEALPRILDELDRWGIPLERPA